MCGFEGCDRPHEARGLCHAHFEQRRSGRPLRPILDTPVKRFMAKVELAADGHWMWQGATSSEGRYGSFSVAGRTRPAHVAAWLLFRGPIPDSADDVDHLCRVTLCVNPDHLEPKSHRENVLAGVAPSALNATKTHCARGHEFTSENTLVTSQGGRSCRACRTSPEGRRKQREATARWRSKLTTA